MKKILVPTDFSESSTKALQVATELGHHFNAQLTLLHAYHPIPYAPEMYYYSAVEELNNMQKDAEKQLTALCDVINQDSRVEAGFLAKQGLAADAIADTMNDMTPDLTVMGNKGWTALERAVMGSVTASVAKNVSAPLLMVPPEAGEFSLNKIVYATDFHDSDLEAINFLIDWAKTTNGHLCILHIANEESGLGYEEFYFESFEEQVREAIDYPNISFHLLEHSNVAQAIEDFSRREGAGLIAVCRQKRAFFLRVFLPSITKKMIYHTELPLLIFQGKEVASEPILEDAAEQVST